MGQEGDTPATRNPTRTAAKPASAHTHGPRTSLGSPTVSLKCLRQELGLLSSAPRIRVGKLRLGGFAKSQSKFREVSSFPRGNSPCSASPFSCGQRWQWPVWWASRVFGGIIGPCKAKLGCTAASGQDQWTQCASKAGLPAFDCVGQKLHLQHSVLPKSQPPDKAEARGTKPPRAGTPLLPRKHSSPYLGRKVNKKRRALRPNSPRSSCDPPTPSLSQQEEQAALQPPAFEQGP